MLLAQVLEELERVERAAPQRSSLAAVFQQSRSASEAGKDCHSSFSFNFAVQGGQEGQKEKLGTEGGLAEKADGRRKGDAKKNGQKSNLLTGHTKPKKRKQQQFAAV